MPIHIVVMPECDICGSPIVTHMSGVYSNVNITKVCVKIDKSLNWIAKKYKAKIAKTSGRVICKDCAPTANKSPKWSKG